MRYGTLARHERVLDLRDGVLRRDVEWASPAGQAVRIRSTRLVSFVQRAIAAIRYEVEPVDASRAHRRAVGAGRQRARPGAADDPRAAAALRAPLVRRVPRAPRPRGRARSTGRAAAACGWRRRWTTWSTGPDGHGDRRPRASRDLARVTVSTELGPGETLRVVKLLAYGWSSQRSMPAAARPGRRRARGGQADRLGRAARRSARVPRRLLGPRRRRDRRRRRAPAGGPVRALPGRCRPAPAPSSARSRPRG